MTRGERRLAERLEAKLESDYLIWYDVPVGRQKRHPDFIIFHPRRGVLVLEVKDWKTDTIHSVDRAQTVLVTDTGLVHALNPFEQSRQLAEQVADLLQRDPLLVNPSDDQYRGKLCFPWTFGVVFPFITRKQFDDAGLGQVLPDDHVICADEMHAEVDAEEFQRRLWQMFPWQPKKPLSVPQIERLRWHLFPEIRIAPPHQESLLSIEAPDVLRVMDAEQERLARSLGDGHRVIHGVAGSGKTMILVYRCEHLAKLLNRPILVLCYNKALAERLTTLIDERGVSRYVHVRNFHGWCRDQLSYYHCAMPTTTDKNEYANELVERLGAALERGQVPDAQYGAVLVDEGHDFDADWLKIVVKMVDPATNSLLVLYDDAQSIYKPRGSFSFRSVGIEAQGRTTILRLNYRNTAEVLNVAHKFAQDVLKPHDADDDGVPLVQPTAADRHGPEPQLHRLATLRDEAAYLARLFYELHEKGYAWAEMAVLYRSGFVEQEISAAFDRARIPTVTLTKRGPGSPSRSDRVALVTFHSSKGLEYRVVGIVGLGFLPGDQQLESAEVRLAYVAMTRSTERLVMTYHRESPFVKRLVAARSAANQKSRWLKWFSGSSA
jgi:nuclease-like protein/UvrD-like helicase family protein/AAA domain-containing protein